MPNSPPGSDHTPPRGMGPVDHRMTRHTHRMLMRLSTRPLNERGNSACHVRAGLAPANRCMGVPLTCVFFLATSKGVAPLPAGADDETGVKDEATRDSADRGAGSGCPPPSYSFSSFSIEVLEDDQGFFYIDPRNGKRINRPREGWGQHTLTLRRLLPSGELGECLPLPEIARSHNPREHQSPMDDLEKSKPESSQ